jgi:succinoglycan biosynthesis transport protein ExoP
MDQLKAQPPQETKLHFLDYWRIIRIRKTVILAVFLLVVITATLVTIFLPQKFQSTARIKVERDQSDISSVQSPQLSGGMPYDPYFIQTEFEVIQSEVILSKVLDPSRKDPLHPDRLDLVQIPGDDGRMHPVLEVWSARYNGGQPMTMQEGLLRLRSYLDVRPTRNTSLIEIRFESESPREASIIANAIAQTYQNYRLEEQVRLRSGGIDALTNRLAEVEKQVHDAQKKVDDLRIEYKIPDMYAAADAPSPMFSAESLRHFEQLRIEGQATLESQRKLLDQLKALASDPDGLAQAIPTSGIQDPLLTTYLENLSLTESKLVSLTNEFGPAHSEVVKVSAQVADLKAKVKERVAGFLSGLEARVASMEQSVISLSNEVERAKETDIEQAKASRPYWEAKRSLDEMIRVRMMLYLKMESETTDLKLPRTSMVEIVDNAKPALRPFRPNRFLNISLGVIIGLVVGIGLAFFIEYLDTSVKTIDDVERSLGSPVLGVIPQNVGILLDEGAESPHAEAYRVLRTNLLFSRKDDKLNTIAIVSAGAGEGKSTTVFNLAAVFAQSGQRILMVDSDLRRPTLHKMLKVTNNIGLTNYLLKQNTLEEVIQTSSLPTLDFMASGKLPSSSLGILSSSQMRDLITELKQHYDYIFFDSPPVMGVSDASILASEVDMTLQVIQYRRYPQPMNIRAKQLIEKVGGNLVGIVLNNINMSQDESYYYYSGYYHDYYSRNEDQEPVPAADSGKDKTT